MKKTILFTVLSSVLFMAAWVQAETTALVGGRLIDGFGHQPLADSVILVRDGRFYQCETAYRKG